MARNPESEIERLKRDVLSTAAGGVAWGETETARSRHDRDLPLSRRSRALSSPNT